MDTKVNYTIVGIFVIVLSTIFIALILWLSSGKFSRQATDIYLAYMRESVSGLNKNAPVKYRGVQVGQVKDIDLDPENSEQVKITLEIARGTPVKEDTEALLKTQGLTGIAYVELTGGGKDSPLLKKTDKRSEQPVIRTKPSLMSRLDTALTEVVAKLDQAADSINAVLDEENRHSLKTALKDIAYVSKTISARAKTIDNGIQNMAVTLENTARVSAELQPMIERINQAADSVTDAADQITETGADARKVLKSVGNDINYLTSHTQPEIEALVADLRQLSASIRRTSEQLEHNPSMLLFGRQSVPGPGE